MDIVIDPNRSAYDNANTYFEKSKKMKQKLTDTKKAIEDTNREIAKEKERLEERESKRELKDQANREKQAKKQWHESYHWFMTNDGLLAIGGKSAGQNEEIVKKRLEPNDLFFHADITGASAVILKNGVGAPEETLRQTAQFSACYSTAWKAGYATIDVYYVNKDQVTKSPPPGEYLEKGSFFIAGRKNYFRSMPLKLLIGIDRNDELKCLPEECGMEKFRTCFSIEPGRYSKEMVAEKIAKQLGKRKDDVMPLIPTGNASFIKMK